MYEWPDTLALSSILAVWIHRQSSAAGSAAEQKPGALYLLQIDLVNEFVTEIFSEKKKGPKSVGFYLFNAAKNRSCLWFFQREPSQLIRSVIFSFMNVHQTSAMYQPLCQVQRD